MKRQQPNLTTKLASALLQIKGEDGQPLIDWEHAKLMSSTQIVSLFQFDHYPIRHEAGGPAEAWNLVPRLIVAHREKTKKDVGEIAKIRRISREHEDFVKRLLTPRQDRKPKRSKWPKRPMGRSTKRS
jgi:hypothetical protein